MSLTSVGAGTVLVTPVVLVALVGALVEVIAVFGTVELVITVLVVVVEAATVLVVVVEVVTVETGTTTATGVALQPEIVNDAQSLVKRLLIRPNSL